MKSPASAVCILSQQMCLVEETDSFLDGKKIFLYLFSCFFMHGGFSNFGADICQEACKVSTVISYLLI